MRKLISLITGLFFLGIATPALSTSLQALVDGQSLIVGDKEFYNWSVDVNDFNADLNQIEVTGDATDPLNIGLLYDMGGQLDVEGDSVDGTFQFDFNIKTVSNLPLIKDHSLELTNFVFDGEGSINITEYLADKTVVARAYEDPTNPFNQLFDSHLFDPVSTLSFNTWIFLYASFGNINYVRLDSFEQYFSQNQAPIPEPTTMLLLGTGLVGVAGTVRRKKKNQI